MFSDSRMAENVVRREVGREVGGPSGHQLGIPFKINIDFDGGLG